MLNNNRLIIYIVHYFKYRFYFFRCFISVYSHKDYIYKYEMQRTSPGSEIYYVIINRTGVFDRVHYNKQYQIK